MQKLVEMVSMSEDEAEAAAATASSRLRDFLAGAAVSADGRLPPERDLAARLGVSRAELRKALADLEAEGVIWRHVGKGTFVGARPVDTVADVAALTRRTNPSEVMQARLSIEPEMARLAALHATSGDIAELRSCIARSRQAETWRQYEAWDNRFHRAIGEATRNVLLLGLLDTLTAVRRAVTWGRLRYNPVRPDPAHHSFEEHEAIVAAIAERDASAAAVAMRTHIRSVERNLLARMDRGDD
jgi:GntR family transcriptional repressor for pyruvate dehydrogenase complex